MAEQHAVNNFAFTPNHTLFAKTFRPISCRVAVKNWMNPLRLVTLSNEIEIYLDCDVTIFSAQKDHCRRKTHILPCSIHKQPRRQGLSHLLLKKKSHQLLCCLKPVFPLPASSNKTQTYPLKQKVSVPRTFHFVRKSQQMESNGQKNKLEMSRAKLFVSHERIFGGHVFGGGITGLEGQCFQGRQHSLGCNTFRGLHFGKETPQQERGRNRKPKILFRLKVLTLQNKTAPFQPKFHWKNYRRNISSVPDCVWERKTFSAKKEFKNVWKISHQSRKALCIGFGLGW